MSNQFNQNQRKREATKMIYTPHGFLKSPMNLSDHNYRLYKIFHELQSDEHFFGLFPSLSNLWGTYNNSKKMVTFIGPAQ